MEYTPPGRHRDFDEFDRHWTGLDSEMGCDRELLGAAGPLGQPFAVAGRQIGNRFAVHPMEGWDGESDGAPSERTLRRWRRFGSSGAKLIWGGEAFAVQEDGRANPHQLFLHPTRDNAARLDSLLAQVRDGHREAGFELDDLYVGLQLTHSGRFARPTDAGAAPRIAYRHPVLDSRVGLDADDVVLSDVVLSDVVLSDGELEAIGEQFVRAAVAAERAGFDFVDVKCCHGYLLHELLGARARPGPYGGSFENRIRLLVRIVDAIRAACPVLEIGVRVSIFDLFPHHSDPDTAVGTVGNLAPWLPYEHGFGVDADDPRCPDLTEPLQLLARLEDLGVRLVNVTAGSPYYCPHVQRPAAYPPSDGYLPPEDPLRSVQAQLRAVRACKRAFPGLALVGTGYTYLQEYLPHVAQHEVGGGHVDFVGLGRMMLSYPDLPADVLDGRPLDRKRLCRTFSDCTTAPRHGLPSGCYPLDPSYKAAPEAKQLRALKRSN